ncbi:hypothetical protein K469DRAFT_763502 [Zopfia rhizophila CBS 207.26]|uniref:VWFA domain-containing protein n=1 Tax=Zopfia rhizophila CBS 207.26 TaxID=1314779 RepID=A0A6A6DDV9_9PEZI|nr:hypothetical protein K469DRAFT_763502 [Zopfia rhizophila CBS 207.26]
MANQAALHNPHLDGYHPLRNAVVAFAVDVSGSTHNDVLTAEKAFVKKVASLLSPRSQVMATDIPWDDKAKAVRGLSRLESLRSEGYTTPGAIIDDITSRLKLKESSLWFLLTDGIIDDLHR